MVFDRTPNPPSRSNRRAIVQFNGLAGKIGLTREKKTYGCCTSCGALNAQ